MKRIAFLVLFILSMVFTLTHGQVVSPSFRNYTAEDGLPSSELYFVLQDKKGNIWFGTDRGLSKFNGYEFESFSFKDGLTDNTIFRLFEDDKERIWMLTYSGRLYYYQDGKIVPFKYNDQLLSNNNGRLPTGLYVDSLENVYISLRDLGIFRVDKNGKLDWQYFSNKRNIINYLMVEVVPGQILTSIIWPQQKIGTINVAYIHDGKLDTLLFEAKYGDRFNAIKLSDDSLLMTVGNALFLKSGNDISRLQEFPGNIFFLSRDSRNNIMIGSDKGGFLLSPGKGKIHSQYFLGNDNVTGMLRDHEGGYWFTTLDNGVHYMPGYGISTIKFEDERIRKPISLTSDFNNSIFAGCWTGALVRIEGSEIAEIKIGDKSNQPVTNLSSFPFNKKIYLSKSGPAYYSDGEITPFKTVSLLGVKTRFLSRKDGSTVCGGSSFIMRQKMDSVLIIGHIPQRVNCLGETKDNELLVGSNSGVYFFEEGKKCIGCLCPSLKMSELMISNLVRIIYTSQPKARD